MSRDRSKSRVTPKDLPERFPKSSQIISEALRTVRSSEIFPWVAAGFVPITPDLGCDLRSRFLLQIWYLFSPSDRHQAAPVTLQLRRRRTARRASLAAKTGARNVPLSGAVIIGAAIWTRRRLKRRALAIHHGSASESLWFPRFGIGCRASG